MRGRWKRRGSGTDIEYINVVTCVWRNAKLHETVSQSHRKSTTIDIPPPTNPLDRWYIVNLLEN